MSARILVGTASWSGHGRFYPAGTSSSEQLPYYARHFPIVEVNTSYYHVPRRSTVDAWVERTPPDFIFNVKPPRELTSTPAEPGGEAPEPESGLAARFIESLEPLVAAGKLGAITFQFPPSYRNLPVHQEYIRSLPERFPGLPLAVEFRRRDWLDEEHEEATLALLREAGLCFTMVDEPQAGTGTVPPVYGVTNARLAVIRFHGRNARTWYMFGEEGESRFNWEYTDTELEEWLPKIERARSEANELHIFFNTDGGDAQSPRNAKRLMRLLGLDVPEEVTEPRQARLL